MAALSGMYTATSIRFTKLQRYRFVVVTPPKLCFTIFKVNRRRRRREGDFSYRDAYRQMKHLFTWFFISTWVLQLQKHFSAKDHPYHKYETGTNLWSFISLLNRMLLKCSSALWTIFDFIYGGREQNYVTHTTSCERYRHSRRIDCLLWQILLCWTHGSHRLRKRWAQKT